MSNVVISKDEVITVAGSVPDPEIRKTMGELGMIDDVLIEEGGKVTVLYHLTSPLCPSPFAISIGREMRRRVELISGVARCEVKIRDHFIAKDIAEKVNATIIDKDAPAWL